MANEISLKVDGQLNNGSVKVKWDTGTLSATQANARSFHDQQTIATTDTALDFGSLTQPGYVRLRNLDPTNYIEAGPDAAGMVPAIRLMPQGPEQVIFIAPGSTWKAKANSADCKLDISALDA